MKSLVLLLVAACSSAAVAEELPLKGVWSSTMPGTTLFMKAFKAESVTDEVQGCVRSIARSLQRIRSSPVEASLQACPAELPEAIPLLDKQLREHPGQPGPIVAGEPSTLLFFACRGGPAIRIDAVHLTDDVLTIHYSASKKRLRQSGVSYAFVPLPPIQGHDELKVTLQPDSDNPEGTAARMGQPTKIPIRPR